MPFELKARIGLDNSPLFAGLEQSKAAVKNFGGSVNEHLRGELGSLKGQFAAAFGVAAITEGIKSIVEYGGHIADLRDKTGLTSDEVQALSYAAGQTGSSFEDVASALKKVAVAKAEALGGNAGKLDAFREFGLTFRDKAPVQIMSELAKKIGEGAEGSLKLNAALELLGKSGDSLFPAFRGGLADMIARFNELNLAIDPGTVDKLDALGDKVGEISLYWKKFGADQLTKGLDSFDFSGLGLFAEGVFQSIMGPLSRNGKASDKSLSNLFSGDQYGSELFAQAIIKHDEENDKLEAEIAKNTAELRKHRADRAEREAHAKAAERQHQSLVTDGLVHIGGLMAGGRLAGMTPFTPLSQAAARANPARDIIPKVTSVVDLLRRIAEHTRPKKSSGMPGSLP